MNDEVPDLAREILLLERAIKLLECAIMLLRLLPERITDFEHTGDPADLADVRMIMTEFSKVRSEIAKNRSKRRNAALSRHRQRCPGLSRDRGVRGHTTAQAGETAALE